MRKWEDENGGLTNKAYERAGILDSLSQMILLEAVLLIDDVKALL